MSTQPPLNDPDVPNMLMLKLQRYDFSQIPLSNKQTYNPPRLNTVILPSVWVQQCWRRSCGSPQTPSLLTRKEAEPVNKLQSVLVSSNHDSSLQNNICIHQNSPACLAFFCVLRTWPSLTGKQVQDPAGGGNLFNKFLKNFDSSGF